MRAVHGAQGWQPEMPHAAPVNCLALQLSRLTEPPSCTGATPMAPIMLPHKHNPSPGTQPNPDLQVFPLPARSMMGSEREREGGREREMCEHQACTPTPCSTPSLGTPPLAGTVLHRDPSPLAPSPSARAHSEHPGCLTTPQGKDQAAAAGALPAPAWLGQAGIARITGHAWDKVAAWRAVRLHAEEVLDALRADRALALVLLSNRLLLGPGEMHLLRGCLHLITRGLRAAGEGGGILVVD